MLIFKKITFLLLSLIPFCMAVSARADQLDTLNFIAGISKKYDNNIFRVEDNEESEQITSAYAGVRLNKKYSLQRFTLDARVTKLDYSNNDFLNFTSKNIILQIKLWVYQT